MSQKDGNTSPIKLDKLTPEEKALIAVYQQKWHKLALSTEKIDLKKFV